MAFDGNGTFTPDRTYANETPPVDIDLLDDTLTDLAGGLSNAITRDGQGKPSANIDWNAKKITNLADATAGTDALNRQTADARYLASEGTFTATLSGFSGGGKTTTLGYIKQGNLATVFSTAALTFTSNSNAFSSDAIPASIRPVREIYVPCGVLYDNSVEQVGLISITPAGIITFFRVISAGGLSSSWTGSGIKGWNNAGGFNATYPLT